MALIFGTRLQRAIDNYNQARAASMLPSVIPTPPGVVQESIAATPRPLPQSQAVITPKLRKVTLNPSSPFGPETELMGADIAKPEIGFAESYARAERAQPVLAAIADKQNRGLALTPQEETFLATVPGNYPDFRIGPPMKGGSRMFGSAAQEMAESIPYGRRMANEPLLDLGPVAQRSLAVERPGAKPIGNVTDLLEDIYTTYRSPEFQGISDIANEFVFVPRHELANRIRTSGGTNIVNTAPIETVTRSGRAQVIRQISPGDIAAGRSNEYGYNLSPYQDISARPWEDRSFISGLEQDDYLKAADSLDDASYQSRVEQYRNLALDGLRKQAQFEPTPGLPFTAADIGIPALTTRGGVLPSTVRDQPVISSIEGYSVIPEQTPTTGLTLTPGRTAYRQVLPERAYINPRMPWLDEEQTIPNVIIPRSAERTIVGSLSAPALAQRLRNQNPEAYRLVKTRMDPVGNPEQVDFRQLADQNRLEANQAARLRGYQLDQELALQNAQASGANTANFIIRDTNPKEFYLYGSQAEDVGNLPDEMMGATRTYAYAPSESLVNVSFDSRPVKPVTLPANRIGLGVPIEADTPYSRAAVRRITPFFDTQGLVLDRRYVSVDPISPPDLETGGAYFAQGKGLLGDQIPETAIAQDQMAANRFRAIAQLQRGDRAETALQLADAYQRSATDMGNAMDIVNQNTVPSPTVRLTQVLNQGTPEQAIPIRDVEMPFNEALAIMRPYREQGVAQSKLRLPVVPTQTLEGTRLERQLKLPQLAGTPESVSILSDETQPIYKKIAQVDPGIAENQLRRGVQYRIMPDQRGTIELIDPGQPVLDTQGQRMRWQGQPIDTYNPRQVAQTQTNVAAKIRNNYETTDVADPLAQQQGPASIEQMAPVEQVREIRASRGQRRDEELLQRRAAIAEGYTPVPTKDPYDTVILNPQDLADIRGGLSRAEALAARQHNFARTQLGLPPLNPGDITNQAIMSQVPVAERTRSLIQNPPTSGGVFQFGSDEAGYVPALALRLSDSNTPLVLQGKGMINPAMLEPLPQTRMMSPTIRQINPNQITSPLARTIPSFDPPAPIPARIPDRPDLAWQSSPSFRFPANVWRGTL
jgi:hypothetical protein